MALDKSLAEHFNCQPIEMPGFDYNLNGTQAIDLSLNLLQDLIVLAKKEGQVNVSIKPGNPVKVELEAMDVYLQ